MYYILYYIYYVINNCFHILRKQHISRRVLRLENEDTDLGKELYTMENLGDVLWDLVGCNALTWVVLFFCMFKDNF